MNTVGEKNPYRYRGYRYDAETGLYYASSRYYDPELKRFISTDTTNILIATPMELSDKNLYAYCDNNPVIREDSNGNFWLVSVCVGVATQYAGDVIKNLINGKTGLDIFKPTSSVGEYIAAGVTSLIPGKGFVGSLVRNVFTEGIRMVEAKISGDEIDYVESMANIGVGTILDWTFEMASDKVTDFISSKGPQNYSTYAHTARKSNPDLTRQEIYRSMQRATRLNRFTSDLVSLGIDLIRACLPY